MVGVERQRFVDILSWRNQLYPFRKTKLVQTGEPQNGTVLETLRSRPGMLRVRVPASPRRYGPFKEMNILFE